MMLGKPSYGIETEDWSRANPLIKTIKWVDDSSII